MGRFLHMAQPTSPVDVCNLAMDMLNQELVVNIDTPTNVNEELCKRWYDVIRQGLLQNHKFHFSLVGESIPRTGTPTTGEFADIYALPNDFLQLEAIHDSDIPLQQIRYKIYGREIHIDNGGDSSLPIWFVRDVQDISLFPALVTIYLATFLAVFLSNKITVKPTLKADLRNDLVAAKQRALAANGQLNPPRLYNRSKIIDSGRNGRPSQVAGPVDWLFTP